MKEEPAARVVTGEERDPERDREVKRIRTSTFTC